MTQEQRKELHTLVVILSEPIEQKFQRIADWIDSLTGQAVAEAQAENESLEAKCAELGDHLHWVEERSAMLAACASSGCPKHTTTEQLVKELGVICDYAKSAQADNPGQPLLDELKALRNATQDIEVGWVPVKSRMPPSDPIQGFAERGLSEIVELWDCANNIWIGFYDFQEGRWWIEQGQQDDALLPKIYEITHWRLIVGPTSCPPKEVTHE